MDGLITRAKAAYGVLPPGVRGSAASAYGFYLRWWRYGRDTEALVAKALARDFWTDEQWLQYQEERLAVILHRAATRVPFYREKWRVRRAEGDDADWRELRNWPVLDKGDLRANPRAFVADDVNPARLFKLNSSGTSGTPITTWRSRRTSMAWYALFEARTRRWYGVDRRMPWAILGGQIVVPAEQVAPPFWVWNGGLRQLYLSSLHLTETNVAAYLEALRRYGVRHMYGYASSMYWLATMARDRGLQAPRLDVVVSNAEPLLPHHRAVIGDVFGCPVRNTYGMSEIVASATECDHGVLHLWPDVGVVEVLDDDGAPLASGLSGRLICTGLLNPDMPLIRYEVEDRGALSPLGDGLCACGRRLPAIDRIEGRKTDVLNTVDGRKAFWYNAQFYGLPLREGQIVQEALDLVRVNVVPDEGYDAGVERTIRERVRQRLGDVRVEVDHLSSIPRGANGKFRAVINRVHADGGTPTVDTQGP
jgi:phenylacetate-CoA ligase